MMVVQEQVICVSCVCGMRVDVAFANLQPVKISDIVDLDYAS